MQRKNHIDEQVDRVLVDRRRGTGGRVRLSTQIRAKNPYPTPDSPMPPSKQRVLGRPGPGGQNRTIMPSGGRVAERLLDQGAEDPEPVDVEDQVEHIAVEQDGW